MRLIFIGLPGAGKGTQASLLAQRLSIPHISTGDIFRLNMANATPLGLIAGERIDKGEYVPDDVTNAMVRNRLAEADCEAGFILDGYPRTMDQVGELDKVLAETGNELTAVVELVVPDDVVVSRLLLRAVNSGRSDDTAEIIQHRLDVYRRQTAPLIAVYAERDILRKVAGEGDVAEISERIYASLTS